MAALSDPHRYFPTFQSIVTTACGVWARDAGRRRKLQKLQQGTARHGSFCNRSEQIADYTGISQGTRIAALCRDRTMLPSSLDFAQDDRTRSPWR